MEPNKFRESRLSINRLYDKIDQLIEEKAVEESKSRFEKVSADLDALRPEAEGDIQKRSVKNLAIRLNHLDTRIQKLKTKRTTSSKTGGGGKAAIEWDEDRIAQLAVTYLEKVYANMKGDQEAQVMLGTTGKGIRPNYRIQYSDGQVSGFTGSGHKPQKDLPAAGQKNLSDPFPGTVIKSILDEKKTGKG